MPLEVRFSDDADAQLRELGRYIAEKNSTRVALRYIGRLTKVCNGLGLSPHRGTNRDRILRGLRTIGFKRRVMIAFRVNEATVEILAVLYGGQNVAKHFRNALPPTFRDPS